MIKINMKLLADHLIGTDTHMNIALILSGGTGTRAGTDIPKQYVEVCGKPVISYCIETLSTHSAIDALLIAAAFDWQDFIDNWLKSPDCKKKFKGFSLPGENRQLSIYRGLEAIRTFAGDNDYVLIHDAARPLLSKAQIAACLNGARGHDGAMPVLPMKDTVYYSHDGKTVGKLLDRSSIYAGQAPEVFLLGRYYEANRRLLPEQIFKINGSTEPGIMSEMDIAMIPGDEGNFKITTRADLENFRKIISLEKGLDHESMGFTSGQ